MMPFLSRLPRYLRLMRLMSLSYLRQHLLRGHIHKERVSRFRLTTPPPKTLSQVALVPCRISSG